jgi:magnesium-transporting ATPase (P-type)
MPPDLVTDSRALQRERFEVDNSSLTGESEPQECGPILDGSKSRPIEARNLVSPCVV